MTDSSAPTPARPRYLSLALLAVLALVVTACGGSDSDDTTTSSTASGTRSTSASTAGTGLDTGLFLDGALAKTPATEDCTLNGGAETTCYRITVAGYPAEREVGPCCPNKVTDGADKGGIWFDGNAVYDLDGAFIKGLAETYDDSKWKLYDSDGNVIVTDTEEAFDGAARPDVEAQYQNHCVEGRLEWLEGGKPITSTVLIPKTRWRPTPRRPRAAPRA